MLLSLFSVVVVVDVCRLVAQPQHAVPGSLTSSRLSRSSWSRSFIAFSRDLVFFLSF